MLYSSEDMPIHLMMVSLEHVAAPMLATLHAPPDPILVIPKWVTKYR